MAKFFMAYWKPETADVTIGRRGTLNHAASNQFGRVKPGDHVWIVTARKRKLYIMGRIIVGEVLDQDGAAKLLRNKDLWPASYHIVGAPGTAQPIRDINIPGLVESLRFLGPRARLAVDNDLFSAKQLQTMRNLTPESAREIEAAFQGAA